LLAADELPPFIELKAQGQSNFVFVVDHAGRRIPRRLNDLGLAESELRRHIAWDIGALAVARYAAAAQPTAAKRCAQAEHVPERDMPR